MLVTHTGKAERANGCHWERLVWAPHDGIAEFVTSCFKANMWVVQKVSGWRSIECVSDVVLQCYIAILCQIVECLHGGAIAWGAQLSFETTIARGCNMHYGCQVIGKSKCRRNKDFGQSEWFEIVVGAMWETSQKRAQTHGLNSSSAKKSGHWASSFKHRKKRAYWVQPVERPAHPSITS